MHTLKLPTPLLTCHFQSLSSPSPLLPNSGKFPSFCVWDSRCNNDVDCKYTQLSNSLSQAELLSAITIFHAVFMVCLSS